MLIWICALHCEAKPVIDSYRLQKASGDLPFDCYLSDNMMCVVSGIGKIAAAAAVASAAQHLRDQRSLAWINLGVAGTADEPLGSAYLVNKCTDLESGASWYPAIVGPAALPTRSCITSSVPIDNYRDNHLHDMEASGFYQAAQYFSSGELVHGIKVISDNRHEKIGKNRQRTSELIADNLPLIQQQANSLVELDTVNAERQLSSTDLQAFLALAHFSETRKHQLSSLLNYLLNREYDANELLAECRGQSAAQIIGRLESLGHADSRNL